jgi:hypothetical protein
MAVVSGEVAVARLHALPPPYALVEQVPTRFNRLKKTVDRFRNIGSRKKTL